MIIYLVENMINNKIYIGQTKNPAKRWKKHKEKRKNPIQLIHLAIVKYGVENFVFEIITTVLQDSDIDDMEIIVIEQHKSRVKKIGYNIHAGGKLKFDYVNKGKNTYNSGRFIKGQIAITKGIKLTDERKLHLSLINGINPKDTLLSKKVCILNQ